MKSQPRARVAEVPSKGFWITLPHVEMRSDFRFNLISTQHGTGLAKKLRGSWRFILNAPTLADWRNLSSEATLRNPLQSARSINIPFRYRLYKPGWGSIDIDSHIVILVLVQKFSVQVRNSQFSSEILWAAKCGSVDNQWGARWVIHVCTSFLLN